LTSKHFQLSDLKMSYNSLLSCSGLLCDLSLFPQEAMPSKDNLLNSKQMKALNINNALGFWGFGEQIRN